MPFLLALFSTLPGPLEEILRLCGQRWHIETDVRTLKSQLRMDQLPCATREMAADEIAMGITAYSLVRAVIASGGPEDITRHYDRMMYYLQQAKLPRRKRDLSQSGVGKQAKYPNRKT